MIFQGLSDKLNQVFSKLKGKGKLSAEDVKLAMREIKLALLEADVNFLVVKEFVARVSERAQGSEVLESLTPGQQVISIVHDELRQLMGGVNAKLNISAKPPTVVMMVGLQGAGKTTSVAKLAGLFAKQGKRPLLVAGDVYRPAAIKQLNVLGETLGIPVFSPKEGQKPPEIAKDALEHAQKHGNDMLFFDTAGRLSIDEALMAELVAIKGVLHPTEILLVVDAMTGQDAAAVSKAFDEQVGIDSVLLTKMDGDTRGGAALSVRHVTGKPIKFVGMGEKLDELEPFHPDRMASRILGMGDVLSLIEKAKQTADENKQRELAKKMGKEGFDLEDFLEQMGQIQQMGGVSSMLSMMPGMGGKALKGGEVDERQFDRTRAIIQSMTPQERKNPSIINASRKRRIAAGSGMRVEDINRLLNQFSQMNRMMKQMMGNKGKLGGFGKGKGLRFPF